MGCFLEVRLESAEGQRIVKVLGMLCGWRLGFGGRGLGDVFNSEIIRTTNAQYSLLRPCTGKYFVSKVLPVTLYFYQPKPLKYPSIEHPVVSFWTLEIVGTGIVSVDVRFSLNINTTG